MRKPDTVQAARQIRLYLQDGNRDRLLLALDLLDVPVTKAVHSTRAPEVAR